ncbi:MAG: type II secretion system F family protein, partial [Fimbriimonas ginsengisoli]|nr:type II secretion system F family protein [Fimbriimonas ginsengisoli]
MGPLLGKVPLGDVQAFFRQFSAMQNAGLPGAVLFDALARQSHQPKLRRIAEELRALALAGKPASEGLQRYHEVFTPVIVSLIRAGEEGGYLAAALTQAADYLQTEQEIRLIYRKATLYPKMVVGASIVLIVAANAIIASMGKKSFLASPLTEPVTWVFLG